MRRVVTLVFLAIAAIGSWSCDTSIAAETGAQSAVQDQSAIYKAFLDQWVGKEQKPLNVSRTAEAPSPADIKDFTDCAGSGTRWSPSTPASDITDQISQLPYVRPTAPEGWKPQDPHNLIAHGQSVSTAVDSGFSHGLMTLSTVVFDASRHTAAFTYSFVCGGLCGNGGTVIFVRTAHGWARSKKECGSWIS